MFALLFPLVMLQPLQPVAEATALTEITVVARRQEPFRALPLSAYAIVGDPLVTHPNELFDASPGTWISRGSGQEHLTAIRSPVLTGPGACGAFLLVENGVPIRPPGFCNVNNLFETWWEGATGVEVVSGPGSALYGANALHGMINVLTPGPGSGTDLLLQVGDESFESVTASWSDDRTVAGTTLTSSGSFRDQEGYDQQKVHLRRDAAVGEWSVETWLTATNLNQETAGFIFGFEAYDDPDRRTENVNPEAFRDAWSARAISRWSRTAGSWDVELTPYLRSSRMDFLQHFLPGKPLEENGQDSAGLQWLARREGTTAWTVGADIDYADTYLRQTQDGPVDSSSAFLRATRPPGKHYDYETDALTFALYGEGRWRIGELWTLTAGLRAERTRYDYDNRMLDGNTQDDGTPCGFGGCLYTRPADRTDSFTEVAPRLSLTRDVGPNATAYLRLARGFRPPQATELYRLQSGQTVADLDSERLDAAELGYRYQTGTFTGSISAFYQTKENFIFRDADGFNVADGATRHVGIEVAATAAVGDDWTVDFAATFAEHTYAAGRTPDFGERFERGNTVDTAPETLARLSVLRQLGPFGEAELEWVHQGEYFLDAANAHEYGGHDLLHGAWRRGFGAWSLEVRLENLLNERYAERADFAFGNYRYFPGQGRTWLVALGYRG
ncbi:MAG: TonB-dependent receptor [Pseudomonadota bacterium]